MEKNSLPVSLEVPVAANASASDIVAAIHEALKHKVTDLATPVSATTHTLTIQLKFGSQ